MLLRPAACLVLLTIAGCDSADSDAPSFIEGTYTLPDGTTGSFRSEAYASAFPYSGFGTSDTFELKSVPRTINPEDGVTVGLSFIQSGLAPVSGAFASGGNPESDRPPILAYFGLHNVPGVEVEGVLPEHTSTLSVYYPDGTVDLRVVGQTISGEFELEGQAFTTGDTTYMAAVRGRFEMPFEPYRSDR